MNITSASSTSSIPPLMDSEACFISPCSVYCKQFNIILVVWDEATQKCIAPLTTTTPTTISLDAFTFSQSFQFPELQEPSNKVDQLKAGLTLGGVLLLLVLVVAVIIYWRRRKRKKNLEEGSVFSDDSIEELRTLHKSASTMSTTATVILPQLSSLTTPINSSQNIIDKDSFIQQSWDDVDDDIPPFQAFIFSPANAGSVNYCMSNNNKLDNNNNNSSVHHNNPVSSTC
eukprot:m.15897 g.15897  ORF g.15897 m.15897 type:complete len:229 (+) comp4543_c0_seq1:139-825(+)